MSTRREFLKQVAAACALTALPGAHLLAPVADDIVVTEMWSSTLDAYRGRARIEMMTDVGVNFRWDIPAIELLTGEGFAVEVVKVDDLNENMVTLGLPLLSVDVEKTGELRPVGFVARSEIQKCVSAVSLIDQHNFVGSPKSGVFGTMEITAG